MNIKLEIGENLAMAFAVFAVFIFPILAICIVSVFIFLKIWSCG